MASRLLRALVIAPAKRLAGPARWERWRLRYWGVRGRRADRVVNRRWCNATPRISIVSERPEGDHSYRQLLEWLGEHRPELRAEFYLDRLPCRLPDHARLFHAWVQDPVLERDPATFARLEALEIEAQARGAVVVHPARVLSHSRRDVLCQRLEQVGLRTPRFTPIREVASLRARGFPLVVRPRWGHGGGMHRLNDEASLAAWWNRAREAPSNWVAGEYLDVRSEDGAYRKYRYFMAGEVGVPRHLILSSHWEVRPTDRLRTRAAREEELEFVNQPCGHHARFDAARRTLEFDIVAFDYSYDATGQLVVWEANPYPCLTRPSGETGEYLWPTVQKTYHVLADFYARRAGLPNGSQEVASSE